MEKSIANSTPPIKNYRRFFENISGNAIIQWPPSFKRIFEDTRYENACGNKSKALKLLFGSENIVNDINCSVSWLVNVWLDGGNTFYNVSSRFRFRTSRKIVLYEEVWPTYAFSNAAKSLYLSKARDNVDRSEYLRRSIRIVSLLKLLNGWYRPLSTSPQYQWSQASFALRADGMLTRATNMSSVSCSSRLTRFSAVVLVDIVDCNLW
jgi:hypothetical protein